VAKTSNPVTPDGRQAEVKLRRNDFESSTKLEALLRHLRKC
jgi:hypothetical protein